MASPIPFDPEEREDRDRDPAVFDTMERLVLAYEQLAEALHDRLNETGLLIRGLRPGAEQLEGARERLKSAKAEWTAALTAADALLHRRREGGE